MNNQINNTELKVFLSDNREIVINFYNENVKGVWNVTLAQFMSDIMNNFRKITKGDDFKKFDLMGNCQEAKSRLGLFDTQVEGKDKVTEKLRSKYNGTQYMSLV
jgi:hypothetical protein